MAKRYTELDVWKLANEFRSEVTTLAKRHSFLREAWLRQQLLRAAHSACTNVAEGFGRFQPREFARFLRIARGSLEESREHVHQAELLDLITSDDATRLRQLSDRASAAIVKLILYLDRHTDRPNAKIGER